jgi:hypothetical protein
MTGWQDCSRWVLDGYRPDAAGETLIRETQALETPKVAGGPTVPDFVGS